MPLGFIELHLANGNGHLVGQRLQDEHIAFAKVFVWSLCTSSTPNTREPNLSGIASSLRVSGSTSS